jgi:hypothetical protein
MDGIMGKHEIMYATTTLLMKGLEDGKHHQQLM